jgi:hypothetical protein
MTIIPNFEAEAQQHMSWDASGEWVKYFKDLPDYDYLLLASSMNVIKIKEGTAASLVRMLADSEESFGGDKVGAFSDFSDKVVKKAKDYERRVPTIRSEAKNPTELRRLLNIPQNRVGLNAQGVVSLLMISPSTSISSFGGAVIGWSDSVDVSDAIRRLRGVRGDSERIWCQSIACEYGIGFSRPCF